MLRACLCVGALIAAVGCSGRTVVVHDEPKLISEGKERLVVETAVEPDERIRLRAFRERESVFEQHYWRVQESSASSPLIAPAGSTEIAATSENDPDPDALMWGGLAAVVLGLFIVFVAVVVPVYYFGIAAQGAATFLSVTADDQRTTIERVETVRHPSAYVTLERSAGGERLDLGPQPEHGWILTPEILRIMGGKGAEVVVRDGPLSVTVTLGSR